MKKIFKSGQDKLQEIVEVLRKDTLEPAQQAAEKIVAESKEHAQQIVNDAREEARQLMADAKIAIERERNIFHSSLSQAAKQAIESLKQSIEKKLLNDELACLVEKETANPKIIADLIAAMVKAVEREGINGDLTAVIPSTVSAEEVAKILAHSVLNRLKGKTVNLGDFGGGAKLRIESKKATIELTNREVEEMLSRFVRKDFRKLFFS